MNTTQFESARVPDDETFRLENSYTLDATVEGSLLAKAGSMVAYTGDLTFTGQTSAEGGLSGFLKEAATGEGTPVMAVEGTGTVFLADRGKKVRILALDAGDAITVNGEDVLAFESTVDYEVGTIDSLAGSIAGGFTNVYLQGPGSIAITTHGDPIVVEPPVSTDPAATVAWSGTSPGSSVDTGLSEMIGSSSGEAYQLEFTGEEGFVVVQPFEERGPN